VSTIREHITLATTLINTKAVVVLHRHNEVIVPLPTPMSSRCRGTLGWKEEPPWRVVEEDLGVGQRLGGGGSIRYGEE